MVTTNLEEFGRSELHQASLLLREYGYGRYYHPYWTGKDVKVFFNKRSGKVFLSDSDYNVLMMNGSELEPFFSSPYAGQEGFIEELIESLDDTWHKEDYDWLVETANDCKCYDLQFFNLDENE